MDFSLVEKALAINKVTKLVFNKMDVLREVDQWKLINDGELIDFEQEARMTSWIEESLPGDMEVFFSGSRYRI